MELVMPLDMANGLAARRDNTPTSAAVTAFRPTTFVHQQRMANCRFDDILTLISVVEAGSLPSAATRLNVSKSVVSKRIRDLEAALRVELFQRSTGRVKPTE